jgi:hypothetical protein
VDPVPVSEARSFDGLDVPLLRADDENVFHAERGLPEMVQAETPRLGSEASGSGARVTRA